MQEELKNLRNQLAGLRNKLATTLLSEEERKNLELEVEEIRKSYRLKLIEIMKGEMENEKYQGR